MGREGMNPKPISMAKDPWIAAALGALARAQRRAEEIDRQTGTKLVLCKDGQLALVDPRPPEQHPAQEGAGEGVRDR